MGPFWLAEQKMAPYLNISHDSASMKPLPRQRAMNVGPVSVKFLLGQALLSIRADRNPDKFFHRESSFDGHLIDYYRLKSHWQVRCVAKEEKDE